MPELSVDSLTRGSIYSKGKRDRNAQVKHKSRSSEGGNYLYSTRDHKRQCLSRDERHFLEAEWVRNSIKRSSTKEPVIDMMQLTDSSAPPSYSPPPPYSETASAFSPSQTTTKTLSHSPVTPVTRTPRLKFPVVIPQNPRNGGFVRAYAPLLKDCNVDPAAFFYFLDDFDRSAEASPLFSAVNIASIGSLNRPNGVAMLVCIAKTRINTFLDRVNSEFFAPRGLYCLLVTWRPDAATSSEVVDIVEPLFSSSVRQLPFPETASLVYPFGNPTEELPPMRIIPPPNNMYGPRSPEFGRGAGIPRLVGGVGKMEFGGAMGLIDTMVGDRSSMGGRGRLGDLGGSHGLVAGLMEEKISRGGKHTPPMDPRYGNPGCGLGISEPGCNEGYAGRGQASSSFSDGGSKGFKKDAIYLMVVNLPTEDEMAAARRPTFRTCR